MGKKWVCVARTFGHIFGCVQSVDSTVFNPNIRNAGCKVRTRNGNALEKLFMKRSTCATRPTW